jgi:hypothetical protein
MPYGPKWQVLTDQQNLLGQRLGDEEAMERLAVVHRPTGHGVGVLDSERQHAHTKAGNMISQESTMLGMGVRFRCGYERISPLEPFVFAICRSPAFSVMVGNDRAVLILDRFCLVSEPEPIVRPETDPTFAVEE